MHRYSYEDGARLLISPLALPELTPAQAMRIVPYMKLTLAHRGAVLFRAGGPGSHFLVMLLEGDAVVEGQLTGATDPIVLRTLVAGSLFGELGAQDSAGRSVIVWATSDTYLATLEYGALEELTSTDPRLGCTLLRAVLAHTMRRLRTANTRIETLNEINHALRQEWIAEAKSDSATIARLSVLMNMERQTGVRSRPGDERWARSRSTGRYSDASAKDK